MRLWCRRLDAVLVFACVLAGAAVAMAEEPKKNPLGLKAEYKNGFKLTTEDGRFSLRLFGALQFRYTYLRYDHRVKGNEEDYSSFFTRRARLWWDGHAFSPNFTYYFHLQLEPQSAVNLHDAWVAYKLGDLLTVGVGRNKVPYGTEFLASGFNNDFVDRSILSGETDINSGGGFSRWPGGNANFGTSNEHPATGFPLGGLNLFRSQGVSLSGQRAAKGGLTFGYDAGVWQGRDTRGSSNGTEGMLYAARLHLYPFGAVNLQNEGDLEHTERFKLAFIASIYRDDKTRRLDATGAAVRPYDTRDTGHDLSVVVHVRGFYAALEWAAETYEMERDLPANTFEREAWRANFGYFVVRSRVEVVGRVAEVRRLKDPTRDAAVESGLGLVRVLDEAGDYSDALEGTLSEATVGVNLYLGEGHQHKLFFDCSRLGRSFEPLAGFDPADQEDTRFRSMVQLRF
ncbi:MAG: hypothetical protein HY825_10885 [Acidobacteria bacterium]|nr:hypothetical protein [Acidobacteriota bacterium]